MENIYLQCDLPSVHSPHDNAIITSEHHPKNNGRSFWAFRNVASVTTVRYPLNLIHLARERRREISLFLVSKICVSLKNICHSFDETNTKRKFGRIFSIISPILLMITLYVKGLDFEFIHSSLHSKRHKLDVKIFQKLVLKWKMAEIDFRVFAL